MRALTILCLTAVLAVGCSSSQQHTQYTQVKQHGVNEQSRCDSDSIEVTITDVVGVKILNQEQSQKELVLVILVKDNPDNTAWRVINLYANAHDISFTQPADQTVPSSVSFCSTNTLCEKTGECYGAKVLVQVQHGLADIH